MNEQIMFQLEKFLFYLNKRYNFYFYFRICKYTEKQSLCFISKMLG